MGTVPMCRSRSSGWVGVFWLPGLSSPSRAIEAATNANYLSLRTYLNQANTHLLTLHSTTAFGLAVAIIGYACVAPLWFAYHLASSPTVIDPDHFQLGVESPLQIALAPFSIMIGFGIPSVIMTLPAPSMLSFETKQLWTGVQQGWPIWIALAQLSLTLLVSFFNPSSSVYSEEEKKTKTAKSLRSAYMFGLLSGASSNLTVASMCLLAYLFPVLFAAPYNRQLLPDNVLIPVNPFAPLQAQTLADGALWFLQWDSIIGALSTAVWGLTLRIAATHESTTLGYQVYAFLTTAIVSLVLGPCGAAVVLVWIRDESVRQRVAAEEKTMSKKGKAN